MEGVSLCGFVYLCSRGDFLLISPFILEGFYYYRYNLFMTNLRNAILATIIYYDIFNFPLTFTEIYKYLINPKRLSTMFSGEVNVEVSSLVQELDLMVKAGIVNHKNGFYFMPGRDGLYTERIEKDKLANKKWKKFLQVVKYLQLAPYLKAVFASGSLAYNNPGPKSDFDVLVVIKSGRLYTGRLFLWLISSLLGVRRGRFDTIAPDKLCFNHYLADDNLKFSHQSLFIAQSITNMKPVMFSSNNILSKFSGCNKWVNSYCYHFKSVDEYRSAKRFKIMIWLPKIYEILIDKLFGNFIEGIAKLFQQRRIRNNPATYQPGGRVVFNNNELEFHPRSFEKTVIEKFNNGLKKAGIFGITEKDSGLKQ